MSVRSTSTKVRSSPTASAGVLGVVLGLVIATVVLIVDRTTVAADGGDTATILTESEQQNLVAGLRPLVSSLLSFGSASFEEDIAEVTDLTTVRFGERYQDLLDTEARPAVERGSVESVADVVEVGVVDPDATAPIALVFVRQTATSAGAPRRISLTAVTVRAEQVDGAWRIAALDLVLPEGQ